MKKTKRQKSSIKQKQTKLPTDNKSALPSKKNIMGKKQAETQKENKSMSQEGGSFLKPAKKTMVNSKVRSKSQLYQRKNLAESSTRASHRHVMMQALQKKLDKAETDISAHLHSIRYERPFFDGVDQIQSNFMSPHNQD